MSAQTHETQLLDADGYVDESSLYRFRLEGLCEPTRPGAMIRRFDETYELRGDHPAQALERLVRSEVEWGIIDVAQGFTLTFLADEAEA